jgi:hypothetical protein
VNGRIPADDGMVAVMATSPLIVGSTKADADDASAAVSQPRGQRSDPLARAVMTRLIRAFWARAVALATSDNASPWPTWPYRVRFSH